MLARIIALLKKEFLLIWSNRQSRLLIIVPPLIQLFMFGYAVTMEVKNIELGVWDKCQTLESRELVSAFTASKWYSKVLFFNSKKKIEESMDNQTIDCALIINEDFSRKLRGAAATSVYVVLDGRQINSAAIMSGYANQIIHAYMQNTSGRTAPIEIVLRNWFNPNLNYEWTILASIFTMLSTLPCLLLTSMSIAREKELGTFEQLTVSPLTPSEILIGKTLPPFSIALVISIIMTGLMAVIFSVPFVGSLTLLILSIMVALLSVSGVGLFISSLCRTQQQALLGVFSYQMPAILLSGFISPVEDMPQLCQYINYLNPMRYYVVITKGLFLKDMSAATVGYNLLPMLIIGCFTLTVAAISFKRKLD